MLNPVFRFSASLMILFLAALCLIVPSAIHAQGGATGAITATVLDRSGGFVPNAAVQVIDGRTGQVVRSLVIGANGNFTATLLPPGTYAVVVSAQGFGEVQATAVVVRVTETTTLNVTSQPSSVLDHPRPQQALTKPYGSDATAGPPS